MSINFGIISEEFDIVPKYVFKLKIHLDYLNPTRYTIGKGKCSPIGACWWGIYDLSSQRKENYGKATSENNRHHK